MTKNSLSALEKVFIKTGRVASMRAWDGRNVHELHIHLPGVDFNQWRKAQSIKCRISSLHYTDYTPAMWDPQENNCTLYIDTSHQGRGSAWVKQQKKGDYFHYLKIEPENHSPTAGKQLIFLGDQTAIGHFCAIQQLALPNTKISGCLVFNDLHTARAFGDNCPWLPLQSATQYNALYEQTKGLISLCQAEQENYEFYVVGNASLIVDLRKLLKARGIDGARIKSKGFWQ